MHDAKISDGGMYQCNVPRLLMKLLEKKRSIVRVRNNDEIFLASPFCISKTVCDGDKKLFCTLYHTYAQLSGNDRTYRYK